MKILFLLIPLSLLLLVAAVWAFFWAVRSGQFDDLESPAYRILLDDDESEDGRQQMADGRKTEAGQECAAAQNGGCRSDFSRE